MKNYTVFACESQPVVAHGLESMLENQPDLTWAGTASTIEAMLPLAQQYELDILLIDHSFGFQPILLLLAELRMAVPDTLPVFWSNELLDVEALRLLQLGARGIVRRSQPSEVVLECLRTVASGRLWIEDQRSMPNSAPRDDRPRLTARERDIVRLVCQGGRNRDIAGTFGITPGTVKVHMLHIFKKTGVKSRAELAVRAADFFSGMELETSDWPLRARVQTAS